MAEGSNVVFASGAQLQPDGTIVRVVDAIPTPPAPAQEAATSPEPDAAGHAAGDPSAASAETDEMPVESDQADEADEPEAAESQEPGESNRGFRKRLLTENQQFRQRVRNQDATIAYLQQQVDELKRGAVEPQQQQQQAQPLQGLPPRPRQDQYATYTEYEDALLDWRDHYKAVQQAQAQQAEAQRMAQQEWDAKTDEGRAKYRDYDAAVNRANFAGAVAPLLATAFRGSEHGPDLLYHLAKSPKDIQTLNAMDPWAAARWLVALEDRMTRATEVAEKRFGGRDGHSRPSPPTPAPIAPVGTGPAQPVTGFRPGMSLKEYEQLPDVQQRNGRR